MLPNSALIDLFVKFLPDAMPSLTYLEVKNATTSLSFVPQAHPAIDGEWLIFITIPATESEGGGSKKFDILRAELHNKMYAAGMDVSIHVLK